MEVSLRRLLLASLLTLAATPAFAEDAKVARAVTSWVWPGQ